MARPDVACPEHVEGLMHVSGKWIQHAVGVLLVKIFWTSKISCAARIGPYEIKVFEDLFLKNYVFNFSKFKIHAELFQANQ